MECRRTPKLYPFLSPRCCHRHDCCYDTAEKEGCNPKVQRYQWACEHNTVRCGKHRLAPVRGVSLPPLLAPGWPKSFGGPRGRFVFAKLVSKLL